MELFEYVKTELGKVLNRKIIYRDAKQTVTDFRYVNGISKFIIELDGHETEYTVEEAVQFVLESEPCDKQITFNKNVPVPTQGNKTSNMAVALSADQSVTASLKSTVMETIEKLKNDAGYIPQANAISEQIQTLLDIKRVEIDIVKTTNAILYK